MRNALSGCHPGERRDLLPNGRVASNSQATLHEIPAFAGMTKTFFRVSPQDMILPFSLLETKHSD
jgi:hypothetical protein